MTFWEFVKSERDNSTLLEDFYDLATSFPRYLILSIVASCSTVSRNPHRSISSQQVQIIPPFLESFHLHEVYRQWRLTCPRCSAQRNWSEWALESVQLHALVLPLWDGNRRQHSMILAGGKNGLQTINVEVHKRKHCNKCLFYIIKSVCYVLVSQKNQIFRWR